MPRAVRSCELPTVGPNQSHARCNRSQRRASGHRAGFRRRAYIASGIFRDSRCCQTAAHINTNGLRIAAEEDFVARLATYMPDFEVDLQFDSQSADALKRLRGEDLRKVRERALERLNRH